MEDELTELWKTYLVVRFPLREIDAQLLESASCGDCRSDLWVRLVFKAGVLETIESVGLQRDVVAGANYVSKELGELFERTTGQPFKFQGHPRSDWVGIFSAYRAHASDYAKRPTFRVVPGSEGEFVIDGDVSGVWTDVLRECARRQLLHRLGRNNEVLVLGDREIGPIAALKLDDRVRNYDNELSGDTWALHRARSEWSFIEGPQLRALSTSVAVATRSPNVSFSTIGGRSLAIVEEISPRRRRALSPEGQSLLLDVDGERTSLIPEPQGTPLASTLVPWPTAWCGQLGAQLATWAMGQLEGWRTPIALDDVYVTFESGSPTLTCVVPGSSRDYAPREYLKGEPLVSSGEVFSICAIATHVATGEHPFDQGEQGILAERRRPFYGEPRVARIVDRGLHNDPGRRGTLVQLRDDFKGLAET